MSTSTSEANHGMTFRAPLPLVLLRKFQQALQRLVHWAIDTGVNRRAAKLMSLLLASGTSRNLVLDRRLGNEFRTSRFGAV